MNDLESREVQLGRLFVRLADSLVQDFDVVELLEELATSCVDLLDARAAGLMLADQHGGLQVIAASSEETRLLELFELQNQQGPCLDCFRTGAAVSSVTRDEQQDRWPVFSRELHARGFGPVYALPLRLRDETIGALNLFRLPGKPLPGPELQIGQALADVATIAVLEHRTIEASERIAVQLQIALNSRIALEQAKGVIAEFGQVPMERAFDLIRDHARSSRRRLSDVAGDIAAGRLPPASVVDRSRA